MRLCLCRLSRCCSCWCRCWCCWKLLLVLVLKVAHRLRPFRPRAVADLQGRKEEGEQRDERRRRGNNKDLTWRDRCPPWLGLSAGRQLRRVLVEGHMDIRACSGDPQEQGIGSRAQPSPASATTLGVFDRSKLKVRPVSATRPTS